MSITSAVEQVTYETPTPAGAPILPMRQLHAQDTPPAYLQRFHHAVSVTGNGSGGTANLRWQFRTNAATSPKLYIALTSMYGMADEASDPWRFTFNATDYSEWGGTISALKVGVTPAVSNDAFEYMDPQNPIYMGLVDPSSTGQMNILFDTNTNLEVYTVFMRGWWCDQPFEIPLNIK